MSYLVKKFARIPVTMYRNGFFSVNDDVVVKETPINLLLNNQEFATLVCSPGDLKEMAVGFLCSEGIIRGSYDLASITIDENETTVKVETTRKHQLGNDFVKHFTTTCCTKGGPSFKFFNDARRFTPITSNIKLTPGEIFFLCKEVEENSPLFQRTGGSHSAALCQKNKIIVFFEDIGRHNAVDRIFGRCILENINLSDKILIFSGRVSSEILIKIAKMGIPIIAARSAPTELAVNLAKKLGITVVGFVRENRLNIYSHVDRIIKDI